jgi:hypothetical protein
MAESIHGPMKIVEIIGQYVIYNTEKLTHPTLGTLHVDDFVRVRVGYIPYPVRIGEIRMTINYEEDGDDSEESEDIDSWLIQLIDANVYHPVSYREITEIIPTTRIIYETYPRMPPGDAAAKFLERTRGNVESAAQLLAKKLVFD